jgi:phage shock protein PspC (stress-responsive transcriptional regulator)
VFGGVLLGFASYFAVDVVMLRALFSFFVLITGFFLGVAAYIVVLFLIHVKILAILL